MKSGHRVPVAALVRVWAILPIACMFLLAPSFARADASAPQKVAIANTARIFNDMQETKDLKDKLEARRQEVSN